MFCKNCGNEIKEGELNCAACGTPASQPQVQQPEQAPQQPQYQAPQQPQYQVPPQPQYQQPYAPQPPRNPLDGQGLSVAGLVLGICGIVFGWVPFFSIIVLICSILGIVFGVMGRKKSVACYGKASGMATAGLVLGIIGTALCALGVLTCTAPIACAACVACEEVNTYNDYYDDYEDMYDSLYDSYY